MFLCVDTHAASATPPDRAQFEREVLTLQPALKRFAFRFSRNSYDSDDLVQETLCKAFRYRDHFEPGTKLKSWLFTIMANLFRSQCKLRKPEPVVVDDMELELTMLPTQDWALYEIDVRKMIDGLPAYQRDALLKVSAGTSYEDAATSLGCEIGTIKSRVSRARRTLANKMDDIFVRDSFGTP